MVKIVMQDSFKKPGRPMPEPVDPSRIVRLLIRWREMCDRDDSKPMLHSLNAIRHACGTDKRQTREALNKLVVEGYIERVDCTNGTFYRAPTPKPMKPVTSAKVDRLRKVYGTAGSFAIGWTDEDVLRFAHRVKQATL